MKTTTIKTPSLSLLLCCLLSASGILSVQRTVFAQAETAEQTEVSDLAETASERTPEEIAETIRTVEANMVELYQQGRYSEAIPLAEIVLSFAEKVLGPDHISTATKMNTVAFLYSEQGRYDEALPLFERSLAIRETELGSDHSDVASSLNNIAHVYGKKGNYDDALRLYERSLAIKEAALGADHLEIAGILNNLAGTYVDLGRYNDALPLHERALFIRETELGPDHVLVALSLNNLALLYGRQGRYNDALPLHERALSIREAELGSDHPTVADSLSNLASLHSQQGNYRLALPLLKRVLSIQENVLGPTHPSVATSLSNLASLHNIQGNYAAALPLYEQALSIREAALGLDHPEVADILGNSAALHSRLGDYATALSLYERALSIRETALGPNHPDTASSLNGLASLYRIKGDYSTALPLYERSRIIREKTFGLDHPEVADSLQAIASLYQDQGNYIAALPLSERALSIQEAALGPEHPNVATALTNLAVLQGTQGNYSATLPLYERALSIREAVFGPEHPEVAAALSNLGWSHRVQGDYDKALPLYERALSIREAVLGADHPRTAASLASLAVLYQDRGDLSAAIPLYERSLAIREVALGPTHPDLAVMLGNLAVLHKDQNNLTAALSTYKRIALIEEQNLSSMLTSAAEERRQRYLDALAITTELAISFNLNYMSDDATANELGLETVLQRKGRVLDATSGALAQLSTQLTPENKIKLDELSAIRSAIASLHFSGPEQGLEDATIEQSQTELSALQARAKVLEEQLARSSAAFKIETEAVSISAVQSALPANAALVEFVRYRPFTEATETEDYGWKKPRYAAYVLTEQGDVRAVDLGESAEIDALVGRFQKALSDRASSVKSIGRDLDERLMAPIRPLLGDTAHLLLSPDSHLNLIPFDALVDDNNRYLIENHQISYLTSGRDLLKLPLNAPSQQAPVIFANPDYSGDSAIVETVAISERSVDATQLNFSPLPGTAIEAEAIAQQLPNATLLTNAQATETQLKQVQSPSILHIATHGFFLPDAEFVPAVNSRSGFGASLSVSLKDDKPVQVLPRNLENPLLRSGLALAGANTRSSGRDDGIFTALEASGLNLHGTRLVVLSACETGVGSVSNGEGVYGLRRAFAIAGAQSQLMSLWQVDDTGTSELMQLYYENLIEKKQGRSEALRSAQLTMMNTGTYAHPYYWSSFIFSGDWRPM